MISNNKVCFEQNFEEKLKLKAFSYDLGFDFIDHLASTKHYIPVNRAKIKFYIESHYGLFIDQITKEKILLISSIEILEVIYKSYYNSNFEKLDINTGYADEIYKCLTNPTIKIQVLYKEDFHTIIANARSAISTSLAKYSLDFKSKSLSAKNINYNLLVPISLALYFITLYFATNICLIVNHIVFFIQNIFKITLVYFGIKQSAKTNQSSSVLQKYETYTILIPLYRESACIPNLIQHMKNIIYPRNLLTIKLIVEEDDIETVSILSQIVLEEYFEIVKIPYSTPRTKPKALNYALLDIKSEYIVVYDAEDKPDLDQLLRVLALFQNSESNLVCIQSRLNQYNANENILTRLFSIEYSLWFDLFLEGIGRLSLPLPLGGTSNHIKVKFLKGVGGWDAYNVTEDADLGIRFNTYGYSVKMIDSYTMEESVLDIKSWLFQRSRWIKGFIQTYIVYIKNCFKHSAVNNLKDCLAINLFIGIACYLFFITPVMLIHIFIYSNVGPKLYVFYMMNLIFGVVSYILPIFWIILKSKKSIKSFIVMDLVSILVWPFYFVLHFIAAYIALFELMTDPFKWNKTMHGITKLIRYNKVIFKTITSITYIEDGIETIMKNIRTFRELRKIKYKNTLNNTQISKGIVIMRALKRFRFWK